MSFLKAIPIIRWGCWHTVCNRKYKRFRDAVRCSSLPVEKQEVRVGDRFILAFGDRDYIMGKKDLVIEITKIWWLLNDRNVARASYHEAWCKYNVLGEETVTSASDRVNHRPQEKREWMMYHRRRVYEEGPVLQKRILKMERWKAKEHTICR